MEFLQGIAASLHESLDPSAIIGEEAVETFRKETTTVTTTPTPPPNTSRDTPRDDTTTTSSSGNQANKSVHFEPKTQSKEPSGIKQPTRSKLVTPRPENHHSLLTNSNNKRSHDHHSSSDKDNKQEVEDTREDPSTTPRLLNTMSSSDDTHTSINMLMRGSMGGPYDELLERSAKRISLMRKLRNDLEHMRVENAILMDELAMAGSDGGAGGDRTVNE